MLASTTCYWPNGQEVTEYNYQPCNAGTDSSHAPCCDLRTSVCTENGYCIGNANYVYRGGCTDSTWTSSSCAQACSFAVEADLSNFANIYDCDNGTTLATDDQKWCCGKSDGSSCCQDSFNVRFGRPYFPTSASTSSGASTSATSSSSTVEDPASSQTSASGSPTSLGSNGGTSSRTIGIGVGVGAGICAVVLVVAAIFLFKERKKRVAAERKFEAIVEADHGPRVFQRQEMEEPTIGTSGTKRGRIHEAQLRSVYEVQG